MTTAAPVRPMPRWFVATCLECEPVHAQPFIYQDTRDRWADNHQRATGHFVARTEET